MKRVAILLLTATLWLVAQCQIYNPVHWSCQTDSTDSEYIVRMTATIDQGWHLYDINTPENGPSATKIVYDKLSGVSIDGMPRVLGKAITIYDDNFAMDLTYYEHSMTIEQRLKKTGEPAAFCGHITYNVCNDDNSCLSNNRYDFSHNVISGSVTDSDEPPVVEGLQLLDLGASDTAEEDLWSPVTLPATDDIPVRGLSIWWILLMGFAGGLLALLTPCVWPMIPMTISFFLHKNRESNGRRDALLYGLSIVIIYVVLGLLITLLFGASALNNLATNAFFNLLFFALLIVFALSFFGAFELVLPSSWVNSIDSRANNAAGFVSILFMAFTLVLVSFSCTGPIIGTLLVEAATDGGLLAPAMGMLGFSLALSLPFSLCALFPNIAGSLPKSGQWMQQLKVCLGFLELAFALKFFSVADLAYGWGLLSRPMFLSLWFAIFLLMGLYLLRVIRLKSDGDGGERPGTTGLMLGLLSIAFAIYLIPGLWGAPVNAVSAFAPPMTEQDFAPGKTTAQHYNDYDIAAQQAAQQGKKLLIDFSGYGCVNCREMESKVLNNAQVKEIINDNFVLVTLMVDDRQALAEPMTVMDNGKELTLETQGDKWSYLQRHRFGANAQPFYVIQDPKGNPTSKPMAFTTDVQKFIEWLTE